MSKNKHALINMTIPDAEAQLKRNQVVIIPTGSVEQHGFIFPMEQIGLLPIFLQNVCLKKLMLSLSPLLLWESHQFIWDL